MAPARSEWLPAAVRPLGQQQQCSGVDFRLGLPVPQASSATLPSCCDMSSASLHLQVSYGVLHALCNAQAAALLLPRPRCPLRHACMILTHSLTHLLTHPPAGRPHSVPRTRSTLSRLTRSVSKLGSSKSSRARAQAAAAAAAAPTAAQPQAAATHRSVGFIPGPSGPGSGLASRTGGGGNLSGGLSGSSSLHDIAATTAARIKVFEEGAFNLEADLGSLSGGWQGGVAG